MNLTCVWEPLTLNIEWFMENKTKHLIFENDLHRSAGQFPTGYFTKSQHNIPFLSAFYGEKNYVMP